MYRYIYLWISIYIYGYLWTSMENLIIPCSPMYTHMLARTNRARVPKDPPSFFQIGENTRIGFESPATGVGWGGHTPSRLTTRPEFGSRPETR